MTTEATQDAPTDAQPRPAVAGQVERSVRPDSEARWYCLSREGLATLCKDEEDARANATHSDLAWPAGGPHRAVQLVEAGEVAAALERRREYDDALVAAERERCAKLAEDANAWRGGHGEPPVLSGKELAALIRGA